MRYIFFFVFLIGIIALFVIVISRVGQNDDVINDSFVLDGKTWILSTNGDAHPFSADVVPLSESAPGDTVFRNIAIDASNRLIWKMREQLSPTATNPRPAPGAGWEKEGDTEAQTSGIILESGDAKTLLSNETTSFSVRTGMAGYPFTLYDWSLVGDKFYYLYNNRNTLHIVTLKRNGNTFAKEKETSLPYDVNNMGDPFIFESSTHEAILRRSHKNFKENAAGEFSVGVEISKDELLTAYEAKLAKDRKQSEADRLH